MLLTILHAELAVFQDDGLVGQRNVWLWLQVAAPYVVEKVVMESTVF